MANNRIAFGLCEQYGINLPEGATPHDAWEALKKRGIVAGDDGGKSGTIVRGKGEKPNNDSTGKKAAISSTSFPTIFLPSKEYAHVMSELATNLNAEQRRQPIVTKAIGDYFYTVENNGFGNYRVINKEPIDFIYDDEEGDD